MQTRRTIRGGLLALAVGLALALVPAAGAIGTYADASGDSGIAPDLTNVTVASDSGGTLVFRIKYSGSLAADGTTTALFLDTDANPNTGNLNLRGAEYLFGVDRDGYSFGRWTGADWDWDIPYTTVRIFGGDGGITISVNRRELGGTSEFNFWAATLAANGDRDTAPDDGMFNYSLAAAGPHLLGVLVQTSPSFGPKAGRPFTVTPAGLKLPDTGSLLMPRPDSYSCRAKLAGRTLVGRGTGGCTFRIAKKARGKRLAVVVTVSYQGSTLSVPFTYKVS